VSLPAWRCLHLRSSDRHWRGGQHTLNDDRAVRAGDRVDLQLAVDVGGCDVDDHGALAIGTREAPFDQLILRTSRRGRRRFGGHELTVYVRFQQLQDQIAQGPALDLSLRANASPEMIWRVPQHELRRHTPARVHKPGRRSPDHAPPGSDQGTAQPSLAPNRRFRLAPEGPTPSGPW